MIHLLDRLSALLVDLRLVQFIILPDYNAYHDSRIYRPIPVRLTVRADFTRCTFDIFGMLYRDWAGEVDILNIFPAQVRVMAVLHAGKSSVTKVLVVSLRAWLCWTIARGCVDAAEGAVGNEEGGFPDAIMTVDVGRWC